MLHSFAPITGRVKLPDSIKLLAGVTIELCWKESRRQHDPNDTTAIELFFQLRRAGNQPAELVLETDTVLNWESLPNLARDRKKWARVREMVDIHWLPNNAYLTVAFGTLVRQWKFSATAVSYKKTIVLEIYRGGPASNTVEARSTFEALEPFFDLDVDKLQEDEDAELEEEMDADN